MLKRAAEEQHAAPVPFKRRSIEIDPSTREAEWRQQLQQQQQQQQRGAFSTNASSTTDAFLLTADDW